MAVTTGRTHSNDTVSFINGGATCTCHNDYGTVLVYEYIDGIVLPEVITLTVTEHFLERQQLLTPVSIDISVQLHIGSRRGTNLHISVDRSAYGIVLQKVLYERNSFLSVVERLFMQLKDQVAASEMYAINQAIAAIISWIEQGDQLVEHDRLRELIKWAIDDAYRTGSQGPVNAP